MMIKDPKHVHKHRLVMIPTLIGIVVVFGVWAVQVKQMFADHARDQVIASTSTEAAVADYADQFGQLIPELEAGLESFFTRTQDTALREHITQESEGLVIEQLKTRFEQQTAQQEEPAQEEIQETQE